MDAVTALDYAGGASPVRLPEPRDPLALAGGLIPAAARAIGLRAGTPVAVGTYDTYVDLAGLGVRRHGDAAVLLGSTLAVYAAVEHDPGIPALDVTPYPGAGLLAGGTTASAGSALAWLEAIVGATASADAPALEPGAGGLLALPYLAGERTPIRDPDARGALVGLTLSTTGAELYRSFLDAVALSARDHAERLTSHGLAPLRWRAGGGGTRDAAWLQAVADALAAPLDVVAHAGEAVGPADLALRAIGTDTSPAVVRTVEPDAERAARYDELYELYTALYDTLVPTLHTLAKAAA
jgi:xylulokinase